MCALLRYFGYMWSFATIYTRDLRNGDLVSSLRDRRAPPDPQRSAGPQRLGARRLDRCRGSGRSWSSCPVCRPLHLSGRARVARVHPAARSLERARRARNRFSATGARDGTDRLVNLLAAGLICGLLWEFWNYWGGAKWIYNVPILPDDQDLRDAHPRIRRLSAVCRRVFRHVCRRPATVLARGRPADRGLTGDLRFGSLVVVCGVRVPGGTHKEQPS